MCLLLGMSVGAAAWIGQKRRPPAVRLGPATEYGLLRFALPEGWEVETKGLPSELLVEEPRPHRRTLRVTVERPHGRRTDADALIEVRSRGPEAGEPITFLGREGVLVEATFRKQRAPGTGRAPKNDDEEMEQDLDLAEALGAIQRGLCAAVVLDDRLGVIVSLEGDAASGPTNRKLLEQFLATMQRVPATQLTTQAATRTTTQPSTRAASHKESL